MANSITKSDLKDFFKDLLIIGLIVFSIRYFIMDPFKVSGLSMSDTFYDKEYIIIDKLSYRDFPFLWSIREPQRGDVVVFRPNVSENKKYYIKRIIGVPWDVLKIEKGDVYVKAKWEAEFTKLQEGYLNEVNSGATFVKGDRNLAKQYEIPEWKFFVMWDNRQWSTDSRECFRSCSYWNHDEFITEDDIAGIVFLDLWYFNFSQFEFKNEQWVSTHPRFLNFPKTYDYE